MSLPNIDICLSPDLYHLYKKEGQVVVVVDVIRASTSICVALSNQVKRIIPVDSLEKAFEYKKLGYLVSGERDSYKVEGFDFGNSPIEFNSPILRGKNLVMTTTNGTKAIQVAKDAKHLFIGTFINSEVLVKHLISLKKNVLILCAGWKSTVNVEDTIFAGFLSDLLLKSNGFSSVSDSVSLAITIYNSSKEDLYSYVINSSPRLKSKLASINNDVEFCLSDVQLDVLPEYKNGELIRL